MHSLILDNARRLRDLHDEIHRTVAHRDDSAAACKEWEGACRRFHEAYDALAWPGGLDEGMRLLKAYDPDAVEVAIAFLEVDPLYFRSGYIKVDVVKRLLHAPLTSGQQDRLRRVVLQRARGPSRREFRAFCRLATALRTPTFESAVEALTADSNRTIVRHGSWLMAALRGDDEGGRRAT